MFNYEDYQRETIENLGLESDKLTKDQIYIILEPLEAPENYYCDGEITSAQADARWMRKLKESGLSRIQIAKVIKGINLI
jgi:hypothetical protein